MTVPTTSLTSTSSQGTKRTSWKHFALPVFLLLLVSGLYFAALPNWLANFPDFEFHTGFAAEMMKSHALNLPHPLYHLCCIALHKIFPHLTLSFIVSRLFPFLCQWAYEISLFMVIVLMNKPKASGLRLLAYAVTAFAISIYGPINFFIDRRLFFGYIPVNVFHNPTVLLGKPLSIWLFYFLSRLICLVRVDNKIVWITAVLTILDLLAKPNYVLVVVPVLALLVVLNFLIDRKQRARAMLLGGLAPALFLLTIQYYFSYHSTLLHLDKSHIMLSMGGPMSLFSGHLPEKFLLSILCPALVYILFFRRALEESSLNFAWAVMLVATFSTYFLAESGSRFGHLNFLWCAEMSLLIVCLASAVFVCKLWSAGPPMVNRHELHWKMVVIVAALMPHLIGGVLLNMTAHSYLETT